MPLARQRGRQHRRRAWVTLALLLGPPAGLLVGCGRASAGLQAAWLAARGHSSRQAPSETCSTCGVVAAAHKRGMHAAGRPAAGRPPAGTAAARALTCRAGSCRPRAWWAHWPPPPQTWPAQAGRPAAVRAQKGPARGPAAGMHSPPAGAGTQQAARRSAAQQRAPAECHWQPSRGRAHVDPGGIVAGDDAANGRRDEHIALRVQQVILGDGLACSTRACNTRGGMR